MFIPHRTRGREPVLWLQMGASERLPGRLSCFNPQIISYRSLRAR